MSLTLRQRMELHRIKTEIPRHEPTTLVTGMRWHSAASHSDVSNFKQRQIERGLKPRETK